MDRRKFLQTSGILIGSGLFMQNFSCTGEKKYYTEANGKIVTVTGLIDPEKTGIMLPHEHFMSTFGGEMIYEPQYDEEKLYAFVVPYLKSLKQMGCGTIADCTAAWFGREPEILKKCSEDSGVYVLTNTGYYGAANDRYIPEHAYKETADQLADRWLKEWEEGIDGTGIHPGFLKIGVDDGPLSDIDRKLITAAARVHLQSGLVIAVHTGDNVESVKQQFDILNRENVHPGAWIWAHANKVKNLDDLVFAAQQGAWIELDGVSVENNELHLEYVKKLKERGFLNQILLSHDGNSFRFNDRQPKLYDDLFKTFIPMLRVNGFTDNEINQLVMVNPAKAYTIRIRKA